MMKSIRGCLFNESYSLTLGCALHWLKPSTEAFYMGIKEDRRILSANVEELFTRLDGCNISKLEEEALRQLNNDIMVVTPSVMTFLGRHDGPRQFEGTVAQKYWGKILDYQQIIEIRLESMESNQKKESDARREKREVEALALNAATVRRSWWALGISLLAIIVSFSK